MTYLFDTSTIIDFLRQKKAVYDFIATHESDEFTTSTVCAFELYSGIYRLRGTAQTKHKDQVAVFLHTLSKVLPFTGQQADIAGKLQAQLAGEGKFIDDLDILIASAAISVHATLLTGNPKHFSRIPNLTVIAI